MAIRVLTTIRDDKDNLIGLRIISTKDGIGVVNLKKAEEIYAIRPFDNVRLENHRWKGTECSLDKLPKQDINGNYIKREEELIIIDKKLLDGKVVGFTVMNLDGAYTFMNLGNVLKTADKYGVINAKLSEKDGKPYISGIRKEIETHELTEKEKRYLSVYSTKKPDKPNTEQHKQNNQIKPIDSTKVTSVSPTLHEVSRDTKSSGVIKDIVQGGDNKVDVRIARMKEIVPLLIKAAEAYYTSGVEIMTNYEYDKLYDELEALEKETGVVLANSVTQKVGYTVQSKLAKVTHPTKMMSLDKTKSIDDLANALGGQEGFLGWKLDGLTVVLTYENGKLLSAVTRGNGAIGEDITENAKTFTNIPLTIDYKDRLVLRGEGLISYKIFEEINAKISKDEDKYKNPRNLASGSIRQLDPKITKQRKVALAVFTVVEGFDNLDTYTEKLEEARKLGFEIVDYVKVRKDTVAKTVEEFTKAVKTFGYPVDGLVITIDNIAYGDMLGATNKFPRNAKAFKWQDEVSESELLYIDWSCSRTGAINPVAVFKPVDIEGTTVERASVHNVSIVEQLELGVGDTLQVYKANMIIPQIAENLTRSGTIEIPKVCPVCSGATKIVESNQAKVLYCTNPDCTAKHIGNLTHFVTRDAMNIDGLSEATLEKFVNEGFIRDYVDIYHLDAFKDKIVKMEGFGKRSYDKIWSAIEKSREVDLFAFLYSLGIEQSGRTTSKLICAALDNDLEKVIKASVDELMTIDGIGDKTAKELAKYFHDNADMVRTLAKEMKFKEAVKVDTSSAIAGLVFVITGEVINFANRNELKAKIESMGGKVSGSVSAKTNYLINNDITSNSNKNQTAKNLGVKIITEAEFLDLAGIKF